MHIYQQTTRLLVLFRRHISRGDSARGAARRYARRAFRCDDTRRHTCRGAAVERHRRLTGVVHPRREACKARLLG